MKKAEIFKDGDRAVIIGNGEGARMKKPGTIKHYHEIGDKVTVVVNDKDFDNSEDGIVHFCKNENNCSYFVDTLHLQKIDA